MDVMRRKRKRETIRQAESKESRKKDRKYRKVEKGKKEKGQEIEIKRRREVVKEWLGSRTYRDKSYQASSIEGEKCITKPIDISPETEANREPQRGLNNVSSQYHNNIRIHIFLAYFLFLEGHPKNSRCVRVWLTM